MWGYFKLTHGGDDADDPSSDCPPIPSVGKPIYAVLVIKIGDLPLSLTDNPVIGDYESTGTRGQDSEDVEDLNKDHGLAEKPPRVNSHGNYDYNHGSAFNRGVSRQRAGVSLE
jgi:hypothetical protein